MRRNTISRNTIRRAGEINDTGSNVSADRFYAGDGTAALPSYTFTSDATMGMYRIGATQLGFSVAGAVAMYVSATHFTGAGYINSGVAGTVAAVAFGPATDFNTGIYFPALDQCAIACGGVQQVNFTTTTATFASTVITPDGTVGTPGLKIGAGDDGFYRIDAGRIGVSINGILTGYWNNDPAFLSLGMFYGTVSTLALPMYSKGADDNTGLHLPGGDLASIVCGGISQVNFTTTLTTFPTNVAVTGDLFEVTSDGTAASRGILLGQHNTGVQGSLFEFQKSRGTKASPSAVASGDYGGVFFFTAYEGDQYLQSGFFGSRIIGAVADNVVPTSLWFGANQAGSNDPYASNKILEIGHDGAQKMAWFGVTLAAQQNPITLTNNASGGTADTVSTFAGAVYATDAAAILGNDNQLARAIIDMRLKLKNYGIFV